MSTTANTILGRQQFKSRLSSLGVTKACEAASTIIDDGSTIKIIDTPGTECYLGIMTFMV